MKLYDFKMAPNPRRVRMFLAEKGIEVPSEQTDLMAKECQTEEFTAKNPMQRVPVLELDDGSCIAESVAISRYFEELHPEPPLFGRDAKERAEVEMWNRRMEWNVFWPIVQVFRHTNKNMAHLEVPQYPEWGEGNRPKVDAALKWLDGELAKRRFIAGENFSIADITALVALDFIRVIGRRIDEEVPNIKRWYEEMKARPSYAA